MDWVHICSNISSLLKSIQPQHNIICFIPQPHSMPSKCERPSLVFAKHLLILGRVECDSKRRIYVAYCRQDMFLDRCSISLGEEFQTPVQEVPAKGNCGCRALLDWTHCL